MNAVRSPGSIEKAFTIGALMFFTGAFHRSFYGLYDPDAGASTGTLYANLIWAAIYLTSAFLIKANWQQFRPLISRLRVLILLHVFVFASILWSDAPSLTFVRSGAIAGTTLFGLYLGGRFSLKKQVEILGSVFLLSGVLSAIFSLAFPDYSIGTAAFEGLWLGIYQHKNTLGLNMSMGYMVFLTLSICHPERKWRYRIFALGTVVLILLANSIGSLIDCVVMTWVLTWLTTLRPTGQPMRFRRWLVGLAAIPLFLSPFVLFDKIVESLGRDANLTGRVTLWYIVAESIARRPFLGYGYFAFWRGNDGPLGDMWATGNASAHDGFLDVWIDTGLVGLVLLLIALFYLVRRGIAGVRMQMGPEFVWPMLLMLWAIQSNLTESSFLRPNKAPWVLFIAAAAGLSACERDEKTPVILAPACT